jgi:chromosome segregation protein
MAKLLAESRKGLSDSQQELSKLNAKHAGIQESIHGDIAISKILGLRSKKPGIYGVISDLGNVNSKFSLALETAAGPRIKSIVVENDQIAAECISYLKSNKLGTATFLPLNKIRGSKDANLSEFSNKKGCHGFAIDLVSFDLKFKKVFEYVFANTLVVDNMETARTLGIGKAKMVTLDGDLAERSGIMRGGYRQKKAGGGFKQEDVTKSIDKYESEISKLQTNVSSIEKKRINSESLIEELRKTKADLEGEIIVKEKSLHLEDSDIDISQRQIDELKKESEKIDVDLDVVISEISVNNKELAQGKIKKQELRGKVKQLKNPLLLAELNTFEEMKTKLNEEIIRLDAEIKHLDEQVSGIHDPEKEKRNQTMEQIDNESI